MKPSSPDKNRLPVPAAYRRAYEQLNPVFETHASSSNAEKIEELGMLMFGDLWFPPTGPNPFESGDIPGVPQSESQTQSRE